jgi:hypothetical protein
MVSDNKSTGSQMPEIITYTLRGNNKTSDEYYQTISSFCDEVLGQAWSQAAELLTSYQAWCGGTLQVPPRSRDEAVLELVSLGVLWRVYIQTAQASKKPARRLLAWLATQRKRNPSLKPAVDWLRGRLGGWLTPPRRPGPPPARVNLKHLDILLEWLQASGEFSEEVRRLADLRNCLADLPLQNFEPALQTIIDLGGWFESRSLEKLGSNTPGVEDFLSRTHPGYGGREDYIFTGRQRVEYHLGMLATEMLNRGFRESFLATDRKIVIVPPCLKARPEDECQATSGPFGERCAHCTPGCRINQVTRLGEKHGFAVFIIPDQLKVFSSEQPDPAGKQSTGLLGVSCTLYNASGGWEMKRLGVPAQGLLLDYCGCIWHWHKDGIPTDFNFQQLLRLVDPPEVRQT